MNRNLKRKAAVGGQFSAISWNQETKIKFNFNIHISPNSLPPAGSF